MEVQKTTIRLPKKLYISAKKKAVEEDIPVQELISQGLRLRLHLPASFSEKEENQGRAHAQKLLQFAKYIKNKSVKGPSDLATNADQYLYGEQ